jgi:hypothetical protein
MPDLTDQEVAKVISSGSFSRVVFLVVLGVLMTIGALVFFVVGHMEAPERTGLSQVAGVLDRAVKITRLRGGGVHYRIEIKSADGELVKLTLSEEQLSEKELRNLVGRPILALFDGTNNVLEKYTNNVWELSTGATTIIQYEQTRQRSVAYKAGFAEIVPYLGGIGLVAFLIGVFGVFRLKRTAMAARREAVP